MHKKIYECFESYKAISSSCIKNNSVFFVVFVLLNSTKKIYCYVSVKHKWRK